ncbi:MAG: hypothetical protein A2539_07105 [Elusimicrobia bacterium RIFOXYD2_FULL_34_15]|nr:MAG: hypothetical protein A2539_07105 [Elusimicrobia bacterium RIFOXYD2_FULL_34_15]
MMSKILIIPLLFILVCLGWWANRHFDYPYPAPTNIATEKTESTDFAGLLFGMRRIFADVNWIQTLQYYGGGGFEDLISKEEYDRYANDPKRKGDYGRYKYLLDMCLRSVRIDPYFKYVYAFGGASLAWNLTRYDEGLELLNEGMKNNPQEYAFHLYAAAIIYSKQGKFENVIENLEKALKEPDCPFEIKNILGNIYKKQGKYEKAAKIWVDIYLTQRIEGRRERAKNNLIKLITEKKISPDYLDNIE